MTYSETALCFFGGVQNWELKQTNNWGIIDRYWGNGYSWTPSACRAGRRAVAIVIVGVICASQKSSRPHRATSILQAPARPRCSMPPLGGSFSRHQKNAVRQSRPNAGVGQRQYGGESITIQSNHAASCSMSLKAFRTASIRADSPGDGQPAETTGSGLRDGRCPNWSGLALQPFAQSREVCPSQTACLMTDAADRLPAAKFSAVASWPKSSPGLRTLYSSLPRESCW
jgi:hypothetical protein